VGLALAATLLAIWFKISTTLSEIVVGTVARGSGDYGSSFPAMSFPRARDQENRAVSSTAGNRRGGWVKPMGCPMFAGIQRISAESEKTPMRFYRNSTGFSGNCSTNDREG